MVVIEEEEEKARVSEDGGLEISKTEQKYPGGNYPPLRKMSEFGRLIILRDWKND